MNFLYSTTAITAVSFALLYVITKCWLNFRKLPHVDGPLLAKIGPFWLLYQTLRGDLYLTLPALFEEYGNPLRIAPDYVVTNDIDTFKQIYGARSPFIKGRWFDAMRLGADRDNVMTLLDDKEHAEQRARLLPGYTGREVPGLEHDVDIFVAQLVSLIRKEYVAKEQAFDFARLAGFMTLDVLTKIAFDLEVGYLKDNKDHYDYQKGIAEFVPIMNLCCNHPMIFKIMNSKLVLSIVKPMPEDKVGTGALLGLAHKAVAEHFKDSEKDESGTMIASWKRHGLTQAQCQDESMLAILAGSDSTSTALRTMFLHIVTNPRVYNTLNKEISAALERGDIAFPVIKMSQAKALPYLSAVVKEGLRVFAPLHGLGAHYSNSPFIINGKTIPPGVEIATDWYGITRSKKHFGPDAGEFRPERWIEADIETVKKYEKASESTFGFGKSTCLGQNVALMELHKAIFEVSCDSIP